jgi:hypothetical protein
MVIFFQVLVETKLRNSFRGLYLEIPQAMLWNVSHFWYQAYKCRTCNISFYVNFLLHAHRRSQHTEIQRSWQSRNSPLLVTSSHVVITTTLPVRISSQTKRSKIINEIAPRRRNSAKHEDSFCNFHSHKQSNYTRVYVKYRTFLLNQPAWTSSHIASSDVMLSMFVCCFWIFFFNNLTDS